MDGFEISTDRGRLDIEGIVDYLSRESYWAQGVSEAVVRRAIDGSVCFGVYETATGRQVAFARLVTDGATFAWLCDVFVLAEVQGRGIGKGLVAAIGAYLEPLGLRRWMLATRDAHTLYEKVGFRPLKAPERFMERHFPEVYSTTV